MNVFDWECKKTVQSKDEEILTNRLLLSVFIAEVCVLPQQGCQPEPRGLHPVLVRQMRHLFPRHLRPNCRSRHGTGWLALRGVGHLPQA